MRITVVSRSWPSSERSGTTLVAAEHVKILSSAGHEISIIGSHDTIVREELPVLLRIQVPASGSGALYAPARVNRNRLVSALQQTSPDVVVVEAWQTALTDATVEVASSLGMTTLMISHGSSLHPFTPRLKDVLRSCGWAPYRLFRLPRLISRLSALTTLDCSTKSHRFFDRDLAYRLGVPVVELVNAPAHSKSHFFSREQRKLQVLVVGYFSPIKNQLDALEVAARLSSALQFLFVGEKQGRYFHRCVHRAAELGLASRVSFAEDHECDLADEMSRSLVVLSSSVTEALPLTLIEAMASGTPFAATPVGAVPSLRGGMHANDVQGLSNAVQMLVDNPMRWQHYSDEGRRQHAECFSRKHVQAQLLAAIDIALRESMRARDISTLENTVITPTASRTRVTRW